VSDQGRILSVSLDPLRAGEWVANTPPSVQYSIAGSARQVRRADGDYRPTNDLLNRLLDVHFGRETLLDVVSYRGASLWQFLPSYIWPSVFRAVELAGVLSGLVDECRPSAISCEPVDDETNGVWIGVVAAVAAGRRIPLRMGPSRASLPRRVRDIARRSGLGLARAEWGAAHARRQLASVWARRQPAAERPRSGRTLLWPARGRDWVRQPGADRFHDELLYPLRPALRDRGWDRIVGVECPYGDAGFVAERFASRLRQHDDGIEWRPYFRPGDGSSPAMRGARRVLADAFQRLDTDAGFHAAFEHRGVRLWPALAAPVARAFRYALPDCAGQLAAAASTLDAVRPDAVAAVYENGPFARALVIEAGRRGIPTLGLQHGTIFSNHYDYMHRSIVTSSSRMNGFVVPDVTCVWGSAWRESLVSDGHYPPAAVAVTGNWRYDTLPEQLAAVDVRELRARLDLPDDVAAILSSGQGTRDYVAAALDAVAARGGLGAIIRLHPSDDPEPVRAELRRRGLPDSVMPGISLIELLALSRVVISQWSTVVAEAALAGRPVILVNLARLPGGEAYVDAGVCLPVNDAAGIAAAIASLLDDPQVAAELGAAREKFVRQYFHQADGGAAGRVADVLEGLVARDARAADRLDSAANANHRPA
jgi:hypothetical protein